MLVNLRNSRPALVVFGLAGAAALLVVVTANLLGAGVASSRCWPASWPYFIADRSRKRADLRAAAAPLCQPP